MAKEEERRISPALIIIPATIAVGAIGVVALVALAAAAPPVAPPVAPVIYTCPYCEAEFDTEAQLLTHLQAEHPEEPPLILYTCPYCGLTFDTPEELDYHIKTVGLLLNFSNPIISPTVWDAALFDIEHKKWMSPTVTGIKALDTPAIFPITSTTFLLRVMEMQPLVPGPSWFGPYQVTIPRLGEYTWNSREGKIDGISTLDLPRTKNQSLITATVRRLHSWAATIGIEEAKSISGYRNVAELFVGTDIYVAKADVPILSYPYGYGQSVVAAGDKINAKLEMVRGAYDYEWHAWDFTLYREFPASYYQFSGTLTIITPVPPYPYIMPPFAEVRYSVTGVKPEFSVYIVELSAVGTIVQGWLLTGPGSGTIYASSNLVHPYQPGSIQMYAHPSLDPPKWLPGVWEYYNWVYVTKAP